MIEIRSEAIKTPEQFELVKLKQIFYPEIILRNIKYSFARVTINSLIKNLKLKIGDHLIDEKYLQILETRLEELRLEHFKEQQNKIVLMKLKEDNLYKFMKTGEKYKNEIGIKYSFDDIIKLYI